MSPKLKHVDMNGQSKQSYPNVPPNQSEQFFPQNIQYQERITESPAVSYGRHESAFAPQPKRPPPSGPPPPPPSPPSGHMQPPAQPSGHMPNLRMLQRHSVTTLEEGASRPRGAGSPVMAQKLSKRSKSVPSNPDEDITLPSPPPPLSVKESYLANVIATNRPPSPPLPPPPPEMMYPMRNEPPPPPPPSNMPYNQNQTSYNEQVQFEGHRVAGMYPGGGTKAPPPPPVTSIPKLETSPAHIGSSSVLPSKAKGTSSVLPSNKDLGRAPRDQSPGMMDEINRVQLKRTGNLYVQCLKIVHNKISDKMPI